MEGRFKDKEEKMNKCSVCKSRLRQQKINFSQELEGKVYVVSDVPALICPQCGEQYLSANTVDKIQEVIEKGEQKKLKPVQHIPVFHFT